MSKIKKKIKGLQDAMMILIKREMASELAKEIEKLNRCQYASAKVKDQIITRHKKQIRKKFRKLIRGPK